jgi:hypothetical protein
MVWTFKKLVAEEGILSSSYVKPGKVLPPATAEIAKQFYVSVEISRIMPGTKDYISVNSESKEVYLQKQLTLCNPKEELNY